MNDLQKDQVSMEIKESPIDCQIRNLKTSFNLQNFFTMYTEKRAKSDYKLSEFGLGSGNFGVSAIRHYLWLVIKLGALYATKYVNRLSHRRGR